MRRLTAAAAATAATLALIAAGCASSSDDDDDCDATGVVQVDRRGTLDAELIGAVTSKGGGGKKSSGKKSSGTKARKKSKADLGKPARKASPKPTASGKVSGSHRTHRSHVDLDDFDCDDD